MPRPEGHEGDEDEAGDGDAEVPARELGVVPDRPAQREHDGHGDAEAHPGVQEDRHLGLSPRLTSPESVRSRAVPSPSRPSRSRSCFGRAGPGWAGLGWATGINTAAGRRLVSPTRRVRGACRGAAGPRWGHCRRAAGAPGEPGRAVHDADRSALRGERRSDGDGAGAGVQAHGLNNGYRRSRRTSEYK